MVNNPSTGETGPGSAYSAPTNWTTPSFAQNASSHQRSPLPVPLNPFLNAQGSSQAPPLPSSVWNPSQTTWGPLADNWRNQQPAPLAPPVSIHPEWNRNPLPFSTQLPHSPQTSNPSSNLAKKSSDDDYGETGISWAINALIDLPLRFLGPPGRLFLTSGGRYFLGFLGFTFLTYSGVLVASDWLEWPWADSLIPSNLVTNLIHKIG